ncbi:MAG: LCP family protein [Lachnospiraceae bacterium]|nr:LCP family protein [Lachnospiraceae bacterium]
MSERKSPRSTQADGLAEEYLTALDDDLFRKEEEDSETVRQDQELASELGRSIEEQLAAYDQQDEMLRKEQGSRSDSAESGHHRSSGSRRSSGGSRSSSGIHSGRSGNKRKRKNRDSWSRGRRRSRILIGILIFIVILLLLVIGGFFVLRYMGEQNLKKSVVETPVEITMPDEEENDDENLVVYNGERYWYNEDVISILCIGVDRQEFASSDDMVIGGNGQADADVLVVIDKSTGKITFLNISRDTMVDLDRYNVQGQYIDTVNEQLCLSFAFGNGQETSCENTALSVSRLLYGMPINAYVAIDFESIATLNDAVGGVTVPVTEEIAEKFPGYEVGALVTLSGSEAVTYIRTRDTALLDSNNTRMSRQKQYVTAFLKQTLEQIKADPTQTLTLFNSVSDNMVTSLKLSEITYFGSFFAQNGFSEENLISLQGEVIEGEDGFAQFMPDETALYETVLNLFYTKE